jgi:branched-chain amino acid aminotransferase
LDGITRQTVITLAREEGLKVYEHAMTKYDVYTADECFLTGSAAEIIPVVKIDARVIGAGKPGPVTKDLTRLFHELTRSGGF